MYNVISANRGPNRDPKNWRVFEREAVEKHFGKVIDCNGEDGKSVLDTYNEYKDSVSCIRWYPDPELMNAQEYSGMLEQDKKIGDIPYLVNSPKGFKSVQCKDEAFRKWKRAGVDCPNFFSFSNIEEFRNELDAAPFTYPFLIRANDSVAGNHTFMVNEESQLDRAITLALGNLNRFNGIDSKAICVEFIDTIDRERNLNFSFRIHATSQRVVSGYGRVVAASDWLAITAGKFNIKNIDNWIYYNKLCENICKQYEKDSISICRGLM